MRSFRALIKISQFVSDIVSVVNNELDVVGNVQKLLEVIVGAMVYYVHI